MEKGQALLSQCHCQTSGNGMRSVNLLEFLLPVSRPGHLGFVQICLHSGSPHTGMPVIPERTLWRAQVQEGEGTCQLQERHSPKKPHLLFLTRSLAAALQTPRHRRMGACSGAYRRTCKRDHTENIRVMHSRLMGVEFNLKVCVQYRLASEVSTVLTFHGLL